MGEEFIELVKVGEIGIEEFLRPEGSQSTGKKESADENISTWATEVGREVASEYGDYSCYVHWNDTGKELNEEI